MNRSLRCDVWVLAAYCVLIFILSHRPVVPMPMLFPHQDKLHHLVAYALMALLAWRAFSWRVNESWRLLLVTVLFCSLYGLTDEYHQSFIVGRHADPADWLADTAGAFVAAVMLLRHRCRFTAVAADG